MKCAVAVDGGSRSFVGDAVGSNLKTQLTHASSLQRDGRRGSRTHEHTETDSPTDFSCIRTKG